MKCWVPSGQEARIGRYVLPGGMIYVGKGLAAVSRYGALEPALIDPSLARAEGSPDHRGVGMSYWPSYSDIPSSCRSGYLAWLAGGRSDPNAYIGYVFLFFYGLERRAIYDITVVPEATNDLPAIIQEVRRLLNLYGDNGSFRNYASSFLDLVQSVGLTDANLALPPDLGATKSWQMPFSVRWAAATFALKGMPLPADWAIAWVRCDPEIRLRTPARRCPEEFDALFRQKYVEKHGDGLMLSVCKRTITLEYRPASASFGSSIKVDTALPDVTALVAPRRALSQIASDCDDELGSFSRFVGKNPEARDQLAAAALLPKELVAEQAPAGFVALRDRLEGFLARGDAVALPAEQVLGEWLPPAGQKQTKKMAVDAARLLAHAGFGVEPDMRFGGQRVGREDKVVLFRLGSDEHETPTPSYMAATLLLHLAVMVSTADGDVSHEEEAQLTKLLAGGLHLDFSEQRRLAAHLQLLLAQPPGFAGVKKRIEALGPAKRQEAGRFLIQVAASDGVIDPGEVKSLTKIFRALDLDPGKVHQWIHEVQSGGLVDGPTRVRPAERATGYAIPPRPQEKPSKPVAPARRELDMEAVQAKIEETAAVSAMLSDIFSEADGPAEAPPPPVEEPEAGIAGLDAAHSTLLRRLGQKATWEWDEFEQLAESLGLMANGALDQINEVAFDVCDQPLTDGTDPVVVDAEVYGEVTK